MLPLSEGEGEASAFALPSPLRGLRGKKNETFLYKPLSVSSSMNRICALCDHLWRARHPILMSRLNGLCGAGN
jgi:hypothetical protein